VNTQVQTPDAAGECEASLALRVVSVPLATDPDLASLEGVNWSVQPGEWWVVAGLHASGKTDLLHCAAGLTKPLAGVCRLFGKPLPLTAEGNLATRLRLGLVFDGGNLLDHLSLAENIALPLRYHHNLTSAEALPRIQPWLDGLGLQPVANRAPDTVSRNWRRRAGLARALVMGPDLLLLDNPLTGLDARQAGWWLDTLGRLAQGDAALTPHPLTLVVTTESLRPWRGLATRFALVHERQLVELGPWRDVAQSTHPVVRELLAAGHAAAED
jgi:ABC-type transporter Mla maintaining outer membrane lipid asymmetry ATPase subunit MlaF